MAYNENLADKIRLALAHVNGKMCFGVDKKDIMLRCTPEVSDDLLPKKGVKVFDLTGKPMKGWLLIGPEATKTKKVFDFGFL